MQAVKTRSGRVLIRSLPVLRGLAATITLLSFGGMTAYAASHVQNADAPLRPAVVASSATPSATVASSSLSTRSSVTVPTTSRQAVTRTHSS